jgi:hypothetical protein
MVGAAVGVEAQLTVPAVTMLVACGVPPPPPLAFWSLQPPTPALALPYTGSFTLKMEIHETWNSTMGRADDAATEQVRLRVCRTRAVLPLLRHPAAPLGSRLPC